MNTITIVNNPDESQLNEMGVMGWPIWEKEISEFPWRYDAKETCYLLEGEVTVIPDGQDPVEFGAGDLVTFPEGMNCTWKISSPVRKHYRFG